MRVLKKILLTDDASAKRAFYWLYLIRDGNLFVVRKESGASCSILDCRSWPKATLLEAEKLFNSKVRSKTNPFRKSKRHYQEVSQQLSLF
jgi:hypothetical protein